MPDSHGAYRIYDLPNDTAAYRAACIALLRSSRRVRGGVLLAFPGRCCRGQVFASAFPASRACGLLVGENTISCCIDRARGLPPGPRTRSLSGIAARQPEYVAVSPGGQCIAGCGRNGVAEGRGKYRFDPTVV